MTTRAWLATSAAALLAMAAFAASATEAGAGEDRHGPYARHGNGPNFRHAPRHFEGVPHFKYGGPQVYRHNGNRHHVERHHRFRPGLTFATPYRYKPNHECLVWQPAMTRQGWRYMWINVCYDD